MTKKIFKGEDGIYYKSAIHAKHGIASPSLNMAHGGMGAVRAAALKRMIDIAKTVKKWEVRYMRRKGNNMLYMGSIKETKEYGIYVNCDTSEKYKVIKRKESKT